MIRGIWYDDTRPAAVCDEEESLSALESADTVIMAGGLCGGRVYG